MSCARCAITLPAPARWVNNGATPEPSTAFAPGSTRSSPPCVCKAVHAVFRCARCCANRRRYASPRSARRWPRRRTRAAARVACRRTPAPAGSRSHSRAVKTITERSTLLDRRGFNGRVNARTHRGLAAADQRRSKATGTNEKTPPGWRQRGFLLKRTACAYSASAATGSVPAASASANALSVDSHVNSGSSRPK